jgi:NAD(P)-dependent dehydrogenase (short-subunit alcohol dehydrogenase family)
MNTRNILILGGYGSTGFPIARHLLQESDVHLILAGRSLEKAQSASNNLNTLFSGSRVAALAVDASDPESLWTAFQDIQMVVVASSTVAYARQVAEAAIRRGIDYLDVQYSTAKLEVLQSLSTQIKNAGLCFVTDGGFHPGLPAALVRFAAHHFDRLEGANVSSVIKIDWNSLHLSPSTFEEFVGEFRDFQTLHFKAGRWQKMSFLGMLFPKFTKYGYGFGRSYAMPMFLEEMRALPDLYPTIKETGFFVGGFNWFVDFILFPLLYPLLWMPGEKGLPLAARLLRWGLVSFSKPPYGTLLKLEAWGTQNHNPKMMELTAYHPDGYEITAIPTVACLLQYLDGSIQKPGLWLQANVVDPSRFINDIERMGVEIKITPPG